MSRMTGKVVFVTGAAGGLGRAVVRRLAAEGADMLAVDLPTPTGGEALMDQAPQVRELASFVQGLGRRLIFRTADVRRSDQLERAVIEGVSELGRLDAVVANAGIVTHAALGDMSDEIWQQTIDVNLTGQWRTIRAALPHMNPNASIVLTSSTAGLKGYPNVGHYSAAKHGLTGLMRTLAQELADRGIRVNTVNPGQMNTPMFTNSAPFGPDLESAPTEEFRLAAMKNNLLPTPWVEPEDVSNAILFLCSEEARFITGVSLPVDAGALIK